LPRREASGRDSLQPFALVAVGLLLMLLMAGLQAAPGVQMPGHTGFVQTVALAEGAACVEHDSRAACDGRRLCCGMACSASALIVAGGFPEEPSTDLAAAGVPLKSDAQVSASLLYRPPNA
jgi:hypothetical protein